MLINLNTPEAGSIAFKQFVFPDGQPHCEFDVNAVAAAAAQGPIDIVCAMTCAADLLNIGLAIDALSSIDCQPAVRLRLNISYLLGARMDRRIGPGQPASLHVIAAMLNQWSAHVFELRVLDVHSSVSEQLIPKIKVMFADDLVRLAIGNSANVIAIPDAGAVERTRALVQRLGLTNELAYCVKKRDSQTGKLSGFELTQGHVFGKTVTIIDDICDGGGTFAGIAAVLRAAGAVQVNLCVTHGVFSKGIAIAGIDTIFCTDSYPAKCLMQPAVEASSMRWQLGASGPIQFRQLRRGNQVLLTQVIMQYSR
jgi:ribose-phosphate pyrophosphokinase